MYQKPEDRPEPNYPPCHMCKKPTGMFSVTEGFGDLSRAFCSDRCHRKWKLQAVAVGGGSSLKRMNKEGGESK